jgi:coenzyme PQQ precursor peptide PqqA
MPHGWHATLCVVWKNRRGILHLTGGRGCPSSQIAIVAPSAVPLWKVIVGPRADELQPDPQGSGFSLASPARMLARRPPLPYVVLVAKREQGRPMAWTTPTLVEICIGLEINGYLPAEL